MTADVSSSTEGSYNYDSSQGEGTIKKQHGQTVEKKQVAEGSEEAHFAEQVSAHQDSHAHMEVKKKQDTIERAQDRNEEAIAAKYGTKATGTMGNINVIIFNARNPSNPNIPSPGGGTVTQQQDVTNRGHEKVSEEPPKGNVSSLIQHWENVDQHGNEIAAPGEGGKKAAAEIGSTGSKAADFYEKKVRETMREEGTAAIAQAEEIKKSIDSLAASGNPWLTGNAYTRFQINMMQLEKELAQIQRLSKKVEIMAENMVVEMGKGMAAADLRIGELQMEQAIMKAVCTGIATVGGMIFAGAGGMTSLSKGAGPLGLGGERGAAMIGQGIQGAGQVGGDLVEAAYAMPIAQQNAMKDMLTAYQEVIKQLMNDTGSTSADAAKQIDEIIQRLDQIRAQLQQAFNLTNKG